MSSSEKRLVRVSKFLSLVLRHKPEHVGLRLDYAAWAQVDELLACSDRAGLTLTRELVAEVVESSDKQRFTMTADGARIRANQGHSIDVDLGLGATVPPEVLFHGTARRSLEGIRALGLVSRSRQHVHLSLDEPTAVAVGRRHGKPVVLRIAAGKMHEAGHEFYRSKNGVWLTDRVPVEFIGFPNPTES